MPPLKFAAPGHGLLGMFGKETLSTPHRDSSMADYSTQNKNNSTTPYLFVLALVNKNKKCRDAISIIYDYKIKGKINKILLKIEGGVKFVTSYAGRAICLVQWLLQVGKQDFIIKLLGYYVVNSCLDDFPTEFEVP